MGRKPPEVRLHSDFLRLRTAWEQERGTGWQGSDAHFSQVTKVSIAGTSHGGGGGMCPDVMGMRRALTLWSSSQTHNPI